MRKKACAFVVSCALLPLPPVSAAKPVAKAAPVPPPLLRAQAAPTPVSPDWNGVFDGGRTRTNAATVVAPPATRTPAPLPAKTVHPKPVKPPPHHPHKLPRAKKIRHRHHAAPTTPAAKPAPRPTTPLRPTTPTQTTPNQAPEPTAETWIEPHARALSAAFAWVAGRPNAASTSDALITFTAWTAGVTALLELGSYWRGAGALLGLGIAVASIVGLPRAAQWTKPRAGRFLQTADLALRRSNLGHWLERNPRVRAAQIGFLSGMAFVPLAFVLSPSFIMAPIAGVWAGTLYGERLARRPI